MTVDLVAFGKLVRKKRDALDWSGEALAAEALGNAALKGKVSEVENGRANPTDGTIRKYCRALGITADALPGLSAILHDPASGKETIDQLIAEKGGLERALRNAEDLHLYTLKELARLFGIDPRPGIQAHELRAELMPRAQDYLNLRREVEELRAKFPRLDNLLADALGLLDQGPQNAAKVRAMMRDARASFRDAVLRDAIEQDTAMAEVEAAAALAEGDAQGAFDILSTAADMFHGIDADQVVERRLVAVRLLYEHGHRRSGSGLALSERMAREVLARIHKASKPEQWARAQNNLAVTLRLQGSRTAGNQGVELLGKAVRAYRDALTVMVDSEHSFEWAMTMQNLAAALRNQGSRIGGQEGGELLAEAARTYRAALVVVTQIEYPMQWAMMMQNLAIALRNLGSSLDGEEGEMLLAESVDSYRAALTVYTETAHPLDWATTKQNLGAALSNYGSRIAGLRGIELFGEAAEAYREAMRVRTEIDQPLQWAMTQENLAVLEECWSEHAACNDRLSHLNAALLHVEAALTAYNPEHMSYGLKKASDLRDRLLAAIAALS